MKPQFMFASGFSEGLAPVCDRRGKFGYIDRSGKYFIEPQFQAADSFSEGLALVSIDGKAAYIKRRYGNSR